MFWFEICSTNDNDILHISRSFDSRNVCKIWLWSVEYISNQSTANFGPISSELNQIRAIHLKSRYQSISSTCKQLWGYEPQWLEKDGVIGISIIVPLMATRVPSQYKDHLSRYGIPVLKIRWSWDPLIYNMGILILARWHLYIETTHRWYDTLTLNMWGLSYLGLTMSIS